MGSKPKPYKKSAEDIELERSQLEELKSKESEVNEQEVRRKRGNKSRSLINHMPTAKATNQKLGG